RSRFIALPEAISHGPTPFGPASVMIVATFFVVLIPCCDSSLKSPRSFAGLSRSAADEAHDSPRTLRVEVLAVVLAAHSELVWSRFPKLLIADAERIDRLGNRVAEVLSHGFEGRKHPAVKNVFIDFSGAV